MSKAANLSIHSKVLVSLLELKSLGVKLRVQNLSLNSLCKTLVWECVDHPRRSVNGASNCRHK